MKNMKRLLSVFLVLILVLSALASCKPATSGDGDTTTNDGGTTVTPDGKVSYIVEVKSLGGMKLEGIMCYVHEGANDYTVGRAETDENGVAKIELPAAAGYTIELDGVPEGYKVESRYNMGTTGATITLVSAVMEEGAPSGGSYQLGDVMHDFTVTTIDGRTLKLSELLDEKKMVLINYWYTTCTWCIKEFPVMNSAYNKYKDKIEIVAINDYASDSETDVKNFAETNELSFPVVKDNTVLPLARFFPDPSQRGYPSSVIIDRYGVVCVIESGAIVNEKTFTNAFDHFTAPEYEQKLIKDLSELTPVEKPNISMPPKEEIAAAFNGGELDVYYHAEESEKDKEWAWPFIVAEKDGKPCIRPSNNDKDNSFAILYAEVKLKAGEALLFDYFSSTQNVSANEIDLLYVLVDGKDIYTISGISEDWATCCAYVATEDKTYTVAFCYQKDLSGSAGDDTVYLRNLRIVPHAEIPTETYIFRFAATGLNESNTGYNNYVTVVYNETDGYYHVGTVNGPLLLVNLLGRSNFDSDKMVTQRLYLEEDRSFIVNGKDCFDRFIAYCNYASNSKIDGYCPVTKELQEYLRVYTETYRREVGKEANENLWLQLCAYYDAYGPDVKQLEDPIKGLSYFSAYDAVLGGNNTVTYNRIIVPRGYLYRFVPEVSGVYRVTSHSEYEVDGWIFRGPENDGVYIAQKAIPCATDGSGERFCEELIIRNEDGTLSRDFNNCSMVAYMEAGKAYYIDICFNTVEQTGTFTFDIKYLDESFDVFCEASPGAFTSDDENFGNIVAGGIKVKLCDIEGDERYGYYCELREDGTLGYIVYADFRMTTTIFYENTILEMIDMKESGVEVFDFGEKGNYTEKMREYATKILEEEDFPERAGCVPVDEELAKILQLLLAKYTFENVDNAWLKVCYYYNMLGPAEA